MDKEQEFLLRHVDDIIGDNALRKKPQFIGFLDERQCHEMENHLRRIKFESFRFFGGYDSSVRNFIGVNCYGEILDEEFPFCPIKISFRPVDKLTHRDFLGALMALGIKRESIGDIVVSDSSATLFADNNVTAFIKSQLSKVGRVGVRVEETHAINLENKQGFEEKHGTISSMRIDSVVALALSVSREKAKEIIEGKGVEVNYIMCQNTSKKLSSDDKLTIRGYGKFIVHDTAALSKKGRTHIIIKKYV